MLFNSYIFIFGFLPTVFVGFFVLARLHRELAAAWLAAASLVFYGWFDARYVGLLAASITVNYLAGWAIGRSVSDQARGRARALVMAGLLANLTLLAYYKYYGFFADNLNQLTGTQLQIVSVVLPLGISFFTFTQIAFLVDTYQGKVKEYNFIHYILFVTYFPHLIAGPILHHKEMMPQFARTLTYRIDRNNVAAGLAIFVLGLAKKVLIADSLAAYATPVFSALSNAGHPMLIEAWVGALAYTLQLYFDFSGYCDMAIGLSLMFNVRLPMNFNSPYKSTSIIEFWRRWHMTLSRFLRDYLYVPLGGNRSGKTRRYVNLSVTMLLGGLWHGAAWTFIVWGALHGVYLILNHAWRALKQSLGWGEGGRLSALGAGALTFFAVVVAWVFFRAESASSALQMLSGMAGMNGVSVPEKLASGALGNALKAAGVQFTGAFTLVDLNLIDVLPMLCIGLLMVFCLPNACELLRRFGPTLDEPGPDAAGAAKRSGGWATWLEWRPTRLQGIVYGVLLVVVLKYMASAGKSEFLYFQF